MNVEVGIGLGVGEDTGVTVDVGSHVWRYIGLSSSDLSSLFRSHAAPTLKDTTNSITKKTFIPLLNHDFRPKNSIHRY